MAIKRLENLLNPNDDGGLGDIVRRARDMGELTEVLRAAVDADAARNILAANIRDDGTLVAIVSSSAWASRLRFEAATLLAAARAAGAEADACDVRVSRRGVC